MKSVADIMDEVQNLTEDNSLTWEQDMSASSFYVDIGDVRLKVWQWTDENDGSSGISVMLSGGKVHETVLDHITVSEYSGKFDKYKDFFNVARRSALQVDSKIADIQKALSKLSQKKS